MRRRPKQLGEKTKEDLERELQEVGLPVFIFFVFSRSHSHFSFPSFFISVYEATPMHFGPEPRVY